MSEGRLAGQTAWISGASSGIGAATARLFAQEGARVALADQDIKRSRVIADGIAILSGQALALECDVRDEGQIRRSIDEAATQFGGLDIGVNNAGIVQVKRLHECTSDDWDAAMGVNVKAMFFAVKHALPHLKRKRRGFIVNVGSVSSFVGQANTPIYTTSKHAVLGLTRSIALDYAADGIRCNCVCPGITDTPMLREHLNAASDPDLVLAGRLRRAPMGVALSPWDIAKAIRYLSCDDSAGITGTALTIDCGYLTATEWDTQGQTAFMNEDSL